MAFLPPGRGRAMSTLLYTHDSCVEHDPGSHHPERPDRLRAVLARLSEDEFASVDWREAPKGDVADIERVHPAAYVAAILEAVPTSGHVSLDPDTVMSAASGDAALRATGALCAAVDAVLTGDARTAFCAVRPPGHHAEAARAMGFCLFNNVAVAAEHARTDHGLARVAVVDFDVHHGNGTQHAFENDRNLFYASSHQSPCYPGTGAESERGVAGNVVNAELAPGSGSEAFRTAYGQRILPMLRDFAPELLIVSAGFDAHVRDPLAQLCLEDDDYAWVSEELAAVAADCCDGRMISALEGGYDLEALSNACAEHVRVLMKT
jgi:acetoin utilization deacetylase AcuC-like enzyme